jgi:cytoskeletal protein RodZ
MEVTLTVGEALSGARVRAGLSVDQLSERTKIREKVVSGIERDDYEACGGNLFVRGYIRVMADAVGIDAHPLIQEYDQAHQGEPMSVPLLRPPAEDPESEDPESEDLPEPEGAAEPPSGAEPGSAPEPASGAEPPHVFGAAASGVLAANVVAPPAASLADTSFDLPAIVDDDAPPAVEQAPLAEQAPVAPEHSFAEEPVTEIPLADVFSHVIPASTAPASGTPESGEPEPDALAGLTDVPSPDPASSSPADTYVAATGSAAATDTATDTDVAATRADFTVADVAAVGLSAEGLSGAEATRADLEPVKPEPEPGSAAEPDSAAEPEPPAASAGVAETSLDLKPVSAGPEPADADPVGPESADPGPEPPDAGPAIPVATASAATPKPRPAAGLTSTAGSPRLQSGPPIRSSLSGGDDSGRESRKRRKALLIGAAALIVVAAAVVGGTRAFGRSGNNSAANASGVSAQRAAGSASGAETNGNANANGSAKASQASQASPSAPTVKKLAMGSSPTSKNTQDSLTEVPVQAAEAFGPDGISDGDNPSSAGNLASASPDASWSTDWYATAQFGDLKNGTGLLLDLGSEATVARIALNMSQPSGAGIELMTGNTPELSDLSVVASGENIGGDVVLNVTKPAKVRYLVVWFTTLPPANSTTSTGTWASGTSASYMSDSSAGKFQATITDIAVAAQS